MHLFAHEVVFWGLERVLVLTYFFLAVAPVCGVVAVLLESSRADWRALDVVASSSPSSSQSVRNDELLFARGRGWRLGAEKVADLVAVVALR